MQNFDTLKDIWQATTKNVEVKNFKLTATSEKAKNKLTKELLWGSIFLFATAIFIAVLTCTIPFKQWQTYAAIIAIFFICLLQAVLTFLNYKKIKQINDTHSPKKHLDEWKQYYFFRKKQIVWNTPLYFILLNIAMAIYLIEIFKGRPILNIILFLAVYTAWMIYAYFFLGKKKLKKEDEHLQNIILEIENKIKQF